MSCVDKIIKSSLFVCRGLVCNTTISCLTKIFKFILEQNRTNLFYTEKCIIMKYRKNGME